MRQVRSQRYRTAALPWLLGLLLPEGTSMECGGIFESHCRLHILAASVLFRMLSSNWDRLRVMNSVIKSRARIQNFEGLVSHVTWLLRASDEKVDTPQTP